MTVQDAPSPKAVRDAHPPGVPCWIDSARGDPHATAGFYAGLFGWAFEDLLPETDPGCYLVARLADGEVAAIASGLEGDPAWSTYVCVEDAAAAAARAVRAGGDVLAGPLPVGDAGRMTSIVDATGATVFLWEPGTLGGARVVNAPGSWSWSTLRTRDPARAVAFYREVFGWTATTLDTGFGAPATMLTLPGYPRAIARLEPMPRDRWDDRVPSHWSVTFAVADVEAIVARALRLGGRVVDEPVSLGPARLATLADPDGVAFAVNAYAPQEGRLQEMVQHASTPG
jgi:predicted enzyme related to lactoylglutathione lyase